MERRDFVKSVAIALGGASMTAATACRASGVVSAPRPIGIQLYTLRRLMAAEPERTLAAIAEIGYREVELAGLYGKTPREFRTLLDQNGLRAPSTHLAINLFRNQLPRLIEEAGILGHKWLIAPGLNGSDRTRAGLEAVPPFFNRIGAELQKHGLTFGYHNYNVEFKAVDGIVPMDLLLERTDPKLVKFEADLFWMTDGGADPLTYFARYPGRFALVHVKDRTADGKMVNVGEGAINFAAIFAQASRAGIQHFFVEHDEPPNGIADARVSFEHVRKLLN
jgi:sugar phosphate isomerase/epimerase